MYIVNKLICFIILIWIIIRYEFGLAELILIRYENDQIWFGYDRV
jgi:hypothetical protein